MPHMLGLFCEQNMAIQTANLGIAPSGAGGDTFRSAATKFNENFSNNAHAASRLVGTQAGNVMEVGAFGLGVKSTQPLESSKYTTTGFGYFLNKDADDTSGAPGFRMVVTGGWRDATQGFQLLVGLNGENQIGFRNWSQSLSKWGSYSEIYHSRNTTVDANGFIKSASPIVQLFADKIELNDEAKQQEISFEKLGVGDYLIKGSSGFAQEGWYVETPKDANGNVLFSVIYTKLENGDISVKTYKKKFDFETVSIVADLDNPVDITENRWIDLRLQELPQSEIEIPESITPPEFQPTGLAEAVATVMESYHGPEQ
jgi:hypothetical protein